MALLPFASNHNYDTSLLDMGKKNSEKNSNDETDSNPVITDENNTTTAESDSNEPEDKNSVNNEVVPDEPIEEDGQVEDKEKSS